MLCVYLLTMAGHTSSTDEEFAVFMVERLIGHSSLAEVADLDLVGNESFHEPDGKPPAPPSIVSTMVAVPFYLLGDLAAGGLPAEYQPTVARFFVGLVSPLATALTGALLFLFGLELGYSRRVALLVALAWGLTTFAWVYARLGFRDPLYSLFLLGVCYAAVRTVHRPGPRWTVLTGLAAALAFGTKLASLAALPVVLGYLLLAGDPGARWGGWGRERRGMLAWLGGTVALVVAALAIGGLLRYGVAIDQRYTLDRLINVLGRVVEDPTRISGFAGLLVSPGKGIVLHAPIAVLGVVGLRAMWRRAPREAGLFVLVLLGQILVHAPLRWWHGDEAWGPRYLLGAAPLLALPAGAALCWSTGMTRRLAWGAFAGLAVLGLATQSGGLLVNYLTYTTQTGGAVGPAAEARRWDPEASPILGHWRIFGQRLAAAAQWRPPRLYLARGYYWSDPTGGEPLPRWTDGTAVMIVPNPGSTLHLQVAFVDYRPPGLPPAEASLSVDPRRPTRLVAQELPAGNPRVLAAQFDSDPGTRGALVAELLSDTWSPAGIGLSEDRRELGLHLLSIEAEIDGRPVTVGTTLVPPLPASARRPWSRDAFYWFVLPRTQVLDFWWWHLYFSGLPRRLLVLALPPLLGLVLSARLLWGGRARGGATPS